MSLNKKAALAATLLFFTVPLTACGDDSADKKASQEETTESGAGAGSGAGADDMDEGSESDTSEGSGTYAVPGSQFGLGEEALIPLQAGAIGDVRVTLTSIEAGEPSALEGVEGAEGLVPFYLHWKFTGAAGSEKLAYATPSRVQFRALYDDNQVAGFVSIVGTFEPCSMEHLPKDFGPGVSHEACMVAAAPAGKTVTQGLYGSSTTDYAFTGGKPIFWQ